MPKRTRALAAIAVLGLLAGVVIVWSPPGEGGAGRAVARAHAGPRMGFSALESGFTPAAGAQTEPAPLPARRGSARGPVEPVHPVKELVGQVRGLGLSGSHWSRSLSTGAWTAELGKATGGVEVSCAFESSSPDHVERIDVTREIYNPNYTDRAALLLDVFQDVIEVVAPDLPPAQLNAAVPWVHGNYRLEYPPEAGRRDILRFTRFGTR